MRYLVLTTSLRGRAPGRAPSRVEGPKWAQVWRHQALPWESAGPGEGLEVALLGASSPSPALQTTHAS